MQETDWSSPRKKAERKKAAPAKEIITVCIGFGNMLSLGTASHMINTIFGFGKTDFSTLFGIAFAMHNLGSMLGAPLFGWMYDISGSYRLGYRLALLAPIAIVLMTTFAIHIGQKQQQPS